MRETFVLLLLLVHEAVAIDVRAAGLYPTEPLPDEVTCDASYEHEHAVLCLVDIGWPGNYDRCWQYLRRRATREYEDLARGCRSAGCRLDVLDIGKVRCATVDGRPTVRCAQTVYYYCHR